jgi:hypothetical protein
MRGDEGRFSAVFSHFPMTKNRNHGLLKARQADDLRHPPGAPILTRPTDPHPQRYRRNANR